MSRTPHTERAKAGRGKPRKKSMPAIDPGPFRSRSLAPIGWLVAAVLAGAAVLLYLAAPDEQLERPIPPPVAQQPIPPPPAAPPPPREKRAAAPDGPLDPLGRAPDLRAIFLRYRDSRDPIERALAGRAHRACFPMFMPVSGQAPSTAQVLNALPVAHRNERRDAVDALFARCRAFLAQATDAADIVRTAERVSNGDLAAPGGAARWALIRGDRATADNVVKQTLASKEPYAVQSLSGISKLMMNEQSAGVDSTATDAALALLACDLGAACGPDSLLALQLCATEGRCEGGARERMLARLGALDTEAVEREHARLRMLFDNGAATLETVWRGGR